jgi:hypothetical protein
MKTAALASASITALAVLSTVICGFWIRANNVTDPGSLDFHRTIGITAAVCCVVTVALVAILLRRI